MKAIKSLGPGLALAAAIAAAAQCITFRFGGPVMLIAILLGVALNFLNTQDRWTPGLAFASKRVLQIGIVLLGARLTIGEVLSLGITTAAIVVVCVALTIIVGWWIGKKFGLSSDHAVLSSGAVAICGASAAMAFSSVLPQTERSERNLILTVVGVTTLSTIAMVAYPPLTHFLGFDDTRAGIFIGATIHDVAQVIGAGYIISDQAGETAAIVKLMRVAMLAPAILIVASLFRGASGSTGAATRAVPLFLIGFGLVLAINSAGLISDDLRDSLSIASRWCLIIAVAGLGVRTSIKEIAILGPAPVSALIAQTFFLAALGTVLIFLAGMIAP